MTKTEADTIIARAKANAQTRAVLETAMTIERQLKKAQKLAEGGKVTLSLGLTASYYAHAYPTPEQAHANARKVLESYTGVGENDLRVQLVDPAKPSAGRSIGLNEFSELIEKEKEKPMAHGTGRNITDALAMLIKNLGGK